MTARSRKGIKLIPQETLPSEVAIFTFSFFKFLWWDTHTGILDKIPPRLMLSASQIHRNTQSVQAHSGSKPGASHVASVCCSSALFPKSPIFNSFFPPRFVGGYMCLPEGGAWEGKWESTPHGGWWCHTLFSISPCFWYFGTYVRTQYVFQVSRFGTPTMQLAMWDSAVLNTMPPAVPSTLDSNKRQKSLCFLPNLHANLW